ADGDMPFSRMVGLNVKFTQGEPMSDLPLLSELGVHWVRDTIGWAEVEPSPANPVHDYDPEAFGRFAAVAARMLHDAGVRFVLEVGNEPHNSTLPKLL